MHGMLDLLVTDPQTAQDQTHLSTTPTVAACVKTPYFTGFQYPLAAYDCISLLEGMYGNAEATSNPGSFPPKSSSASAADGSSAA